MARLGLLIAGALVVVVASLHLSCSIGPIWAEEFRGRVVDRVTGEPVEGVEVFFSPIVVGLWYRGPHGTRWAKTDSNGEFILQAEFQVWLVPFAGMSALPPVVTLYHPGYGLVTRHYRWEEESGAMFPGPGGDYEISPELEFIGGARERCDWGVLCEGLDDDACEHLMNVMKHRDPDLECSSTLGQRGDRGPWR